MSTLYHQLAAFTISGLTVGALYALMAFGYTIVYRILGLFNFAHGGVFMIGTFAALFVAESLGASAGQGIASAAGTLALMVLVAVVIGVTLSVGLEYSIFRPIRVRKGGALPALVAGLGAIAVMQEIFGKWKGHYPVPATQPVGTDALFTVFGGGVRPTQLVVFAGALATLFAMQRYVGVSRMGRALRAVGQDANTASLMGIDVQRVILLSFLLAGITAGVAGALSNVYFASTWYFSGFAMGIKGLTAALLGGMGSVGGAIAGGLVLGLAESYGGAVFGAQWQDVIAFAALVIVLVMRPTGIVGERMATVRA
jgi:branched-chain amino acid transport system permease protein